MARKHLIIPALTSKDISRFWSKVQRVGPNECWLWQGSCHHHGYGAFGVRSKVMRTQHDKIIQAHRLAYRLKYGPIPAGLCVCHRCDTPGCVNPRHLFLGSHGDNMRDCIRKGRLKPGLVYGEPHYRAVLTENDVRAIRRKYATGRFRKTDLARKYGVSRTQITRIVSRLAWKHIA